MDSSIVPVVLVVPTVPFVEVDVGQHIDELLLRVGDVPQQLVVEPQDAGPVFIGVALIILADVVSQFRLHSLQLVQHLGIDGPPYAFRQGGPWIELDGGDLHHREEHDEETAPSKQHLFQTHI